MRANCGWKGSRHAGRGPSTHGELFAAQGFEPRHEPRSPPFLPLRSTISRFVQNRPAFDEDQLFTPADMNKSRYHYIEQQSGKRSPNAKRCCSPSYGIEHTLSRYVGVTMIRWVKPDSLRSTCLGASVHRGRVLFPTPAHRRRPAAAKWITAIEQTSCSTRM
jgi:hypothetical protein